LAHLILSKLSIFWCSSGLALWTSYSRFFVSHLTCLLLGPFGPLGLNGPLLSFPPMLPGPGRSNLSRSDLSRSDLSRLNLSRSNLSGSNLPSPRPTVFGSNLPGPPGLLPTTPELFPWFGPPRFGPP